MLRSSIFFALISLLSIPATAQQSPAGAPPTAIRGEVVEADSRTPLAAATVAVWRDEEDVLATGAVTDVNGRFNIEGLMPGDYYVVISFVGYETERSEEHTSELQSRGHLVCRLLLEKKKIKRIYVNINLYSSC